MIIVKSWLVKYLWKHGLNPVLRERIWKSVLLNWAAVRSCWFKMRCHFCPTVDVNIPSVHSCCRTVLIDSVDIFEFLTFDIFLLAVTVSCLEFLIKLKPRHNSWSDYFVNDSMFFFSLSFSLMLLQSQIVLSLSMWRQMTKYKCIC